MVLRKRNRTLPRLLLGVMAAEGLVSHVCVGLLCGIPASGKSSIATQLWDYAAEILPGQLAVFLVQYDRLIPAHLEKQLILQAAEQGGSVWKHARNQIVTCVGHLLGHLVQGNCHVSTLHHNENFPYSLSDQCPELPVASGESDNLLHLTRPPSVEGAMWDRFIFSIDSSLKKMMARNCTKHHSETLPSWLVLIDDNMHYRSMRYEYCQLARKHSVGLCIMHVSCPLEQAMERNRSRTHGRVEEHVISLMHERLEVPDSRKHSWEKYSVMLDGTSTVDVQLLLEIIQQAMLDPLQPSPEEDTEVKAISRYVCSNSVIHQADQILRRCVSLRMAEAKGLGSGKEELKALSADLSKLRVTVLTDLKKGDTTLPFQPEEDSVSDASKDATSLLFQFVSRLFLDKAVFS